MRWTVVGLALLVAGCGEKVDSDISAMLETDFQKGTVTMTCRESSTGSCHALFVFKDDVKRLEVAKGSAATATDIVDFTRYCLDVSAPQNGCKLAPLVEGQQIVRRHSSHN
ncbi:hypothetical protein OF829_03005 [Sphingomonas sp. LB-2]|uniref:hypothetical protein n=1 Tax=Sphingomonas caeni TaxID=2984949 RepID=UPI00223272CA|nr:hypothetical protein [Sphingomonas caeni]MCW3846192.1 hypothetical protein [Sphingomonas caeni]